VDTFISDVQTQRHDGKQINEQVVESFSNIKNITYQVNTSNKDIDERIELLSRLCDKIEISAREAHKLVQANELNNKEILAAVDEEVTAFEGIKNSVHDLSDMAQQANLQISKFIL
jgi:methyl-accepting chemotaxis protein